MKGWTTLGLCAGLIVATGLAFFLYVPVLVIGAVWLFGLAVVLSLGLGIRIGWTLRTQTRIKVIERRRNYLSDWEVDDRPKVVPISSKSNSTVSLEQLTERAALN